MKWIKFVFLFLLFLCNCTFLLAQDKDAFTLSGYVIDSFTGAGIKDVNVYLLSKDSIVIDSTVTKVVNFRRGRPGGSYGLYRFSEKRSDSFRSCYIKLVHPDYVSNSKQYTLKYVGKQVSFELPDMKMKRKTSFGDQHLREVECVATKVKMFYRGDTLVYNADAFNLSDGSMLDALVRQLPGAELNRQGEIFVNGRKIENLLLNGKDFFRGNHQLMLENLPYYTVKQIKVYDQTSERAIALNDSLARKTYVMDVNLKREYSKGYMANVELGAGTSDTYMARLFGLRFTDVSRFAIVGGSNNLNVNNYSIRGGRTGATSRDGRATNHLLTAELFTQSKHNENTLTLALNKNRTETAVDLYEEVFHQQTRTYSTSQNTAISKNLGVSLTNRYILKLPVWMESITTLRFNDRKDESDNRYYESGHDTRQNGIDVLDSLFAIGVALNDPAMITARKRTVENDQKTYEAGQKISLAKDLYTGDIIDVNAGGEYMKSTNNTSRFNRYMTFPPSYSVKDIIENINLPNTQIAANADVAYRTKRLLFNTELSLFANYRYNYSSDNETINDAVSSIIDIENSYRRRMNENRYSMGLRFFYWSLDQKTHHYRNVTFSLPVSVLHRNTNYFRYTVDTSLVQTPMFFEPSLSVSFKKLKGTDPYQFTHGVVFNTSLQWAAPDAMQLITLPLTSDKINIVQGNAHLKSSAVWNSSLSWQLPIEQNYNFYQELSYHYYINRVVNTYRYFSGVYTYTPDNINGTWDVSLNTSGSKYFKVFNKTMTFDMKVNSTFRKMKNYILDGTSSESRLVNNNDFNLYVPMKVSTGFSGRYFIGIETSANWHKARNNLTNIDNSNIWEYHYGGYISAELFAEILLDTDINIIKRTGYASPELNHTEWQWNMEISRSFKKFVLTLKAIDILRQYKSIAYLVNDRGISETRALSLPSYALLTLTYKFNKQPSKKK